jgi:aspartyl-tRNA(Asn)/glutamyl-tRNA(Gln) amidotransferase subunit C
MEMNDELFDRLTTLSKIDVNDSERAKLEEQLGGILSFVEQLNQVEVDGIEPTTQVTGLTTVLRDDQVNADYNREEMLATMPDTAGDGHLRVHAVFNKDDNAE